MSWTQKAKSSGADFEACPAGTHAAVLIGIIDLGTQNQSFAGQDPRDVRKAFLMWELPDVKKQDGSRHVIGREYTVSFHEKAGLRQMVEAWRGKPFAEGEEFDLSKLLGKECLLTIITEEKAGKTFAKLKGVGGLVKGMAKPKPTLPLTSFNLEDNDPDDFPDYEWLPWSYGNKLADIAALSPEWKQKSGPAPSPAKPDANGSVGNQPLAAAPSQDKEETPF